MLVLQHAEDCVTDITDLDLIIKKSQTDYKNSKFLSLFLANTVLLKNNNKKNLYFSQCSQSSLVIQILPISLPSRAGTLFG